MKQVIEWTSQTKEETIRLGQFLSQYLFPGAILTLTGDLGAGKTTFAGGIAKGLQISEDISSPTFNILKCYFHGRIPFYHIDAYRLEEGTNKDIGLEEFIEGNGVCFIEWPNFIQEMIPEEPVMEIEIHHAGENQRTFVIKSDSERFAPFFHSWEEFLHV